LTGNSLALSVQYSISDRSGGNRHYA